MEKVINIIEDSIEIKKSILEILNVFSASSFLSDEIHSETSFETATGRPDTDSKRIGLIRS